MNPTETGQLSSKPQHTRTSSFFSFSSKKSAQQQAEQATRAAELRSPPATPISSGQFGSLSMNSRRTSLGGNPFPNLTPAIQREIKSVVDLALAHAHKVYFSGPLVRRIERQSDGTRPARDEGWVDVWAQLGGTTLSVWDMKAIEEASKRGEEVPPSYINVTDSFIQVLGALTSPATATSPAKRYTNVITLNTAGMNLILLACPSSLALISWSASLRLASWEKSRLEEIYTGHLIRLSLSEGEQWREPASTLVKGRLTGQVKVRVAGQTDWKPLWMVISSADGAADFGSTSSISRRNTLERATSPVSSTTKSRKRISNLFTRPSEAGSQPQLPGPTIPTISLYASNKAKDLKQPLLTMRYVSQAFAVYPERVEVISRSTLLKVEGLLGEEDMAGLMKGKQGWLMVMPETTQAQPVFELLRFLLAIHDAFSLYGRPSGYVWDPRQSTSPWFAYPVGVQRANLFLEREAAEALDPRDDRTAVIRKNLKQIVTRRMYGSSPPTTPSPRSGNEPNLQPGRAQSPGLGQRPQNAPVLPPIQVVGAETPPQISPLDFHNGPQQAAITSAQTSGVGQGAQRSPPISRGASAGMSVLSPITERSPDEPSPATLGDKHMFRSSPSPLQHSTLVQRDNNQTARAEPVVPPITNGGAEYRNIEGLPVNGQQTHIEGKPEMPQARASSSSSETSPPPNDTRLETSSQPPVRSISSPETVPISTGPYSPRRSESQASATQSRLPAQPQIAAPPPEEAPARPEPDGTQHAMVSSPIEQDHNNDLANEAGALYLLQQQEPSPLPQPPRETWSTSEEETPEESDPSGTEQRRGGTPPISMQEGSSKIMSESKSNSHGRPLGRKPSGARDQPGLRRQTEKTAPRDESIPSRIFGSLPVADSSTSPLNMEAAHNADALAAFTFLEQEEQPSQPPPPHAPQPTVPPVEPSPPPSENLHYPSSFAPSKQAAERRAKAQAQQEATYAATHLPGKPNGKNRRKAPGAWAESSDEEDDEEEDEDEDDRSDGEPLARGRPQQPAPLPEPRISLYPSAQSDSHGASSVAGDQNQPRPRMLPLPPSKAGSPHDGHVRISSAQHDDRPRTHIADDMKAHTISSHQAARQSVWSTVLDPQPPPRNASGRGETFVQVDEPESMTKAFQPQGLLSAGLQDKEDRSAKRQEELARETGSSLINVPNKPPPPQTGLLGAITAHERERKREGGVGAALTEKERERRLAEERQRKLDELQRQQIDQLSQTGGQGVMYDPYGQQQQFPGFAPFDPRMSMNPMMLNPYMSGGFPMMPYGNPQQMMAAQLAAQQAYQQAMMSFSQAGGSQAGDNSPRVNAPSGNPTPLMGPPSPIMSQSPNPIQANMMSMDPRMSMMAPMGMMMNPMMGMGMGMGQTFDPRMSQINYLQRPDSGQGSATPGSPSLRQGSPAPPRSGNESPRPQNA